MRWIDETDYAEVMKTEVEPYIASFRTIGYDERISGEPIRYALFEQKGAKGWIVISHGFTESIDKFSESVYYMLQAGYNVTAVDHRGHGYSYRENHNPYVVHINDFESYVMDLKHLVETVVRSKADGLPLYLYCHSMGGCIGAWTIETYPDLFQKAVLSSPMLGLSFGKIPVPVVRAYAQVRKLTGGSEDPSSSAVFEAVPDFENSCDSCEERYLYYHEKRLHDQKLQTCTPSINWGLESVKAINRVTSDFQTARIRIPVLLFQAELDTVVVNEDEDRFIGKVAQGRLQKVPGVKHEIYMSDHAVLKAYWKEIFQFFSI